MSNSNHWGHNMYARLVTVGCLLVACAAFPVLVTAQQDEDKPFVYPMTSDVRKSVPFAMPQEQGVYEQLLGKVPDTPLFIDRDGIIKSLARSLRNHKVPETKQQDHADIAEAIYKADIKPVLDPRVEKFNELINHQIDEDKVSVGLIAFTGLAQNMARRSDIIPRFLVQGVYQYSAVKAGPDTFRALDFHDSGRWTWSAEPLWIDGANSFHASLSGKIDETIQIDLKPYGSDRTTSMRFIASAEVKMEQTFGCSPVLRPEKSAGPEVAAQYQPHATIVVTKSLEGDSSFTFKDAKPYRDEQKIDHPAIFFIKLKAEPYEKVTVKPQTD